MGGNWTFKKHSCIKLSPGYSCKDTHPNCRICSIPPFVVGCRSSIISHCSHQDINAHTVGKLKKKTKTFSTSQCSPSQGHLQYPLHLERDLPQLLLEMKLPQGGKNTHSLHAVNEEKGATYANCVAVGTSGAETDVYLVPKSVNIGRSDFLYFRSDIF